MENIKIFTLINFAILFTLLFAINVNSKKKIHLESVIKLSFNESFNINQI